MLTDLWSDLRYRLRALFRRNAVERELDAELRDHLERETEKLQRTGLPREEARRRARLAFGGLEQTKETVRETRGTLLLETLWQDLRYALRGLRSKPGFTAGVVLTLALGIGANAAMFGILDRLLFRPPAYLRDDTRVHRVYFARTVNRQEQLRENASLGRFVDLRGTARSLTTLGAIVDFRLAVGEGQDVHEYPVAGMSAALFALFDAKPELGRFFSAREDSLPTGTPVAVLGHAYWQSALGGRRDVLGTQLRIGRMWFTIIGVAPKDFVGMEQNQVPAAYLPLSAYTWDLRPRDLTRDYQWTVFQIVAQRAPGVSVATANADVDRAFTLSRLAEQPANPDWPRVVQAERPHVILGPLQAARGPLAGPQAKVVVWVSGVAFIVLLIACANVANLLLARALARRRETGLRLALGVSRGRLIRQFLTESLVLASIGGVAGLVVAQVVEAVVRARLLPAGAGSSVVTDAHTLGILALATLAAAVATGLAPVTETRRASLAGVLSAGERVSGLRPSRLRPVLLVLQATLSVVLLVGAGLFVRSLLKVERLRLGYDVTPVLTLTEQGRGAKLTLAERVTLERRLSEAASSIPGVAAASPAPSIPFWVGEGRNLFVSGVDSVGVLGDFTLQAGNAEYFRVMGTRILRGRGFDAGDRAATPRVTVVSAGMANAIWPGQDPLGKCLRIGADTAPCTTVVGVAEDLHMSSLTEAREFTYYVPIEQYDNGATGMLLVRVAGDAATYAEPVRRALQPLMPGEGYLVATPLRDMVSPQLESWRLGATMFVAFGALALILAGIGLYSVIAYGVMQRRREIGVRLALGAPRRHVLALVMRGGLRLVIAGVVLGSAIALVGGRWMAALLFHEQASDPLVYGGVAATLVLVSLVATALPALAASRLDPNQTLRAD
jgi:putative ABC transport system permease protein